MSPEEVQRWFKKSVTYEGEPYTIDMEQAAAVACDNLNAIVVARAGSGKTRTIVAKIVYLVARCGVESEEIMAFVFNANAASEINARLGKMCVDGEPVIAEAKIASTFHAFSRKIVYDVCKGREKCGRILVDEKEQFVSAVVMRMLGEKKWREKAEEFMNVGVVEEEGDEDNREGGKKSAKRELDEESLARLVRMMTMFVNRAQQRFLAGERKLRESVEERLALKHLDARERIFIELGAECYRRYHWYMLNDEPRWRLAGGAFGDYGTDFNLLVSWASKLIARGGRDVRELLGNKKYILIDEYQDFSQLFLSVVIAMRKVVPGAKLFVVGDDWQAINRFAGSDVEYFKEFEKYFAEDCRRLTIATNYRCNYIIVDTARKFMKKAMGEKGEFRAFSRRAGKVALVNPMYILCGADRVLYGMRPDWRDEVYVRMARIACGKNPYVDSVRCMKALVRVIRKNKKAADIMILHRNNETDMKGVNLVRLGRGLRWGLERLAVMTGREYDKKVRIMTMHKSKGLEAEVVIILEANEGVIPKRHPDTNLYEIFGETEMAALDDQKRLFYVAMTRAKKRLYIFHDEAAGEGFIKFLGKGIERWGEDF